jgi:hypothetical protein
VPDAESKFCPPKLEHGWNATNVSTFGEVVPSYWMACTGSVWLAAAGMLWWRAFSSAIDVMTSTLCS